MVVPEHSPHPHLCRRRGWIGLQRKGITNLQYSHHIRNKRNGPHITPSPFPQKFWFFKKTFTINKFLKKLNHKIGFITPLTLTPMDSIEKFLWIRPCKWYILNVTILCSIYVGWFRWSTCLSEEWSMGLGGCDVMGVFQLPEHAQRVHSGLPVLVLDGHKDDKLNH